MERKDFRKRAYNALNPAGAEARADASEDALPVVQEARRIFGKRTSYRITYGGILLTVNFSAARGLNVCFHPGGWATAAPLWYHSHDTECQDWAMDAQALLSSIPIKGPYPAGRDSQAVTRLLLRTRFLQNMDVLP